MDSIKHKLFVLHLNDDSMSLQAMDPLNTDEYNELQRLEEKGLTKFLVIDSSSSYQLHKSVIKKMIHTIRAVDNPDVEVVDYTRNLQKIVRIKASNISVRETGFVIDNYQKTVDKEGDLLDAIKEYCRSLIGKLNLSKILTVRNANC
jgi:hypothetical protein